MEITQALSTTGRATVLCGFGAPLPLGFSASSPPGPCEGVCSTSGGNGFCRDPGDGGSRLDVYGCLGKTSSNGFSCDGTHNGGVLIASFNDGATRAISDFLGSSFCTFQMDVLRPAGGDPVGLRDFVVWERDSCSTPPSCHCPGGTDYQGNPVTGTACGQQVCGADFQYYTCEQTGWVSQGGSCPETPGCHCPGGTDHQGNPVTGTVCGQQVCGADFQYYTCEQSGWVAQGGSCPETPDCHCPGGTDYQGNPVTGTACGQQVCGADFQYYTCEQTGWVFQGGSCPEAPGCTCIGDACPGRQRIRTYGELAAAVRCNNMQNTDVLIPIDLSVLKEFRQPLVNGSESYVTFVNRLRSDPAFAAIAGIHRALLDGIAANPDIFWTSVFESEDLTGSTFFGPLVYVNFALARATGLRFEASVQEAWFGNTEMTGTVFSAGVSATNFTGAWQPQIRFAGRLDRNALNGSYLVAADFTAVTTTDANDVAFARLDNARFAAGTSWSSSRFTGAVVTGATNPPPALALIPVLSSTTLATAVSRLGGSAEVQRLATAGQLLPRIIALGAPYAGAFRARLPESWRSYVADGLGDGGAIKSEVYDAVDGRYGSVRFVPTLEALHLNTIDTRAARLIDRKLVEVLARTVRSDDAMGLKASAAARTSTQWRNHVSSTSVAWNISGSRRLDQHPIPRETLYQLYVNLASTSPTVALDLRTNLDNFRSFTLASLFAVEATYPGATPALYELCR